MGIVFEVLIEFVGNLLSCVLFQASWRRILLFYACLGLALVLLAMLLV